MRTQLDKKLDNKMTPVVTMLARIATAIVLTSAASCASVQSGQPDSAGSAEEVWREVPKTAPLLPPENTPSPSPGFSTGSKLAASELPVIEPLRQPIEVPAKNTSVLDTPAKAAGSLSVTEMTDGGAEIEESENLIEKPLVTAAKKPDSTKNQDVTKIAKQNVPPTKNQAPKINAASSDIELMCTEVEAGKSIGAEGCAILDGSIAGVGFVANSSELTESAQQVLDSVASVMKKKENLRLSVATYSNDLDDSALGQVTQRRRTLAVIRHLINSGIEASRVRPNTAPAPTKVDSQPDISQYLVVLRNVDQ